MRFAFAAIVLVLGLAPSALAGVQPDTQIVLAQAPPAATPTAHDPAIEPGPPVVAPASLDVDRPLPEQLGAVYDAVAGAVSHKTFMAWMTACSVIFWVLIAFLRKWSGLDALKSGNAVRLATLVLGVLAVLAGHLCAGMPWWQAAWLVLSGPGASAFEEVSKLIRPDKATEHDTPHDHGPPSRAPPPRPV